MALAAFIVAFTACHTARPAPPALRAPPARAAHPALVRDIDRILGDPALERGYWGVLVKSLKTGETLYARNARQLMMPASNMKIVTLAAAAERLGWEHTYETQLLRSGELRSGTLDGDLLVVGSGDPSLAVADGVADRVFDAWAERLNASGIRTIGGCVIGDDNAFDDEELGFGWSWDDLPDDYAAGVSALQFNESAARITIAPGPSPGDWAAVGLTPAVTGLVVDHHVRTSGADVPSSIAARRLPGIARLELRGSIPAGAAPVSRVVSVHNPTLFAATAVRDALIARGIDVRGPAVDIDDVLNPPARSGAVAIASHRSPPLSTLAVRLMKVSQNLYAETLLKTIGGGTFAAGRTAVPSTLQPWGVAPEAMIVRDGSGLSRYDYVTADALVSILAHIDGDERLRAPFLATLPVAGRDGTIANRMKGTAAEGNARAKSGSMSNVRALSGYVTSGDGEPLAFSIIANNFETSAEVVNRATDQIVVALAELRSGPPR